MYFIVTERCNHLLLVQSLRQTKLTKTCRPRCSQGRKQTNSLEPNASLVIEFSLMIRRQMFAVRLCFWDDKEYMWLCENNLHTKSDIQTLRGMGGSSGRIMGGVFLAYSNWSLQGDKADGGSISCSINSRWLRVTHELPLTQGRPNVTFWGVLQEDMRVKL